MMNSVQTQQRNKIVIGASIFFIILLFTFLMQLQPPSAFGPLVPAENQPWNILMVTDLDHSSKVPGKDEYSTKWKANFVRAKLFRDPSSGAYDVEVHDVFELVSKLSEGGRGMELSDLCWFNNKMYSFDDRSGIESVKTNCLVYEVTPEKIIARYILRDGDGNVEKGFKAEWCTVKGNKLVVGGFGKEFSTAKGEYVNDHPQWIKTISPLGTIENINWVDNYNSMRKEAGYEFPGYLLHESGVWDASQKKWYFAPRRASREPYDEDLDEVRGTNLLFTANENFSFVRHITVGDAIPVRGFSSLKLIPGRSDITVFNSKGDILMPDKQVLDHKLEGVEFTPQNWEF